MILYFLRHASAGQKRLNPKKDEKRPLDDQGVLQCTQMGRLLSNLDVTVDAVISSPLKRATQTAALVANEIGYDGKLNIEDALRPSGTYQQFREMLLKYSKAESIMLVGHNPNFSEFLGHTVTDNGSKAFISMKKGAVARVESSQRKMVMQWMMTPRLVRAAAESVSGENRKASTVSRNGTSVEPTEIPSKRPQKKQPEASEAAQPAALTSKSRPKTSRK